MDQQYPTMYPSAQPTPGNMEAGLVATGLPVRRQQQLGGGQGRRLGGQRPQHADRGGDADHGAQLPARAQHARRLLADRHSAQRRRRGGAPVPRWRPHHARPAPAAVLGVQGRELGRRGELHGDDDEPAGADARGLAPRAVVLRRGILQPRAHLHRVAVQDAPVAGRHHLGRRPRLDLARHRSASTRTIGRASSGCSSAATATTEIKETCSCLLINVSYRLHVRTVD